MNKNTIATVFSEKEKVNIGYIVAGYPSVDFTKSFLSNLDRTAIDILEIGIPYSDPLADGKLISQASFAASQAGVTTDTVFDMLASVKGKVHKPLVFLVYYNLVFAYGVDAFLQGVSPLLPHWVMVLYMLSVLWGLQEANKSICHVSRSLLRE